MVDMGMISPVVSRFRSRLWLCFNKMEAARLSVEVVQ